MCVLMLTLMPTTFARGEDERARRKGERNDEKQNQQM